MRHQEGCYTYSTGVTQFRTAHSSPYWGSLHEVSEMQTNINQDTVLCVALEVAYIYTFRPGLDVSELVWGWWMVSLKFTSLVQVDSCTWIHSKNTLFTEMPLDGVWQSWQGNLLSFDLKWIHNIGENGLLDCTFSCIFFIWVKCICTGIEVFTLVHRWDLNNGVCDWKER